MLSFMFVVVAVLIHDNAITSIPFIHVAAIVGINHTNKQFPVIYFIQYAVTTNTQTKHALVISALQFFNIALIW